MEPDLQWSRDAENCVDWLSRHLNLDAAATVRDYLVQRLEDLSLGLNNYDYEERSLKARLDPGLVEIEPQSIWDSRALAEIISSYNAKLRYVASCLELGHTAEAEAAQVECAVLRGEIRKVTFKGRSKSFADSRSKARESARFKLRYLLRLAEAEAPAVAVFLRQLADD